MPSPKPNVTTGDVNVLNGAELMTENGSLRFVVGLNALAAGYDANGNMTLRLKDGARYFLAYDAESRLGSVSGTASASFAYNGDGQRVSATSGTTITTYIGGYFEWQGGAGKSYYFSGAQRIAMRTGTDLKFLLGDHLGSTSVTALASGAFDTETRYYPWGGVRWSSGAAPTDYMFTGQQVIDYIGLYFYNSRFYDAALGRFISPDSIIPNPGNPISFDRFGYVRNNPLKYIDPSGHKDYCGSQGSQYDPEECQESDFADYGLLTQSGKDAYITYIELWGTDGWWWQHPLLGGDGEFSVLDFVALILYLEMSQKYADIEFVADFQEAMTRNYNSWASEMQRKYPGRYGTDPSTTEGLLNYIFAYTGSTLRTKPSDFSKHPYASTSLPIAHELVNTIVNPGRMGHSSWAVGCVVGRPCHFGSHTAGSDLQLDYIKYFIGAVCEPSYRVYGDCSPTGNFTFFLDLSASFYWDDENNWDEDLIH